MIKKLVEYGFKNHLISLSDVTYLFIYSLVFLDVTRPYVGVTPDGRINFFVVERGSFEIKCLCWYKESLPASESSDKAISNYCMVNENGYWKLKSYHSYFYQVPACQVRHCDFVIWKKETHLT